MKINVVDKEKKSKKVSKARKRKPVSSRYQLTPLKKTGNKKYDVNDDPFFILLVLVMSIPLFGLVFLFLFFVGFAIKEMLFGG